MKKREGKRGHHGDAAVNDDILIHQRESFVDLPCAIIRHGHTIPHTSLPSKWKPLPLSPSLSHDNDNDNVCSNNMTVCVCVCVCV